MPDLEGRCLCLSHLYQLGWWSGPNTDLGGVTADLLHLLGSDSKQTGHGKGCVCLYIDSHTFLPSTPGSYPFLLPAPLDTDPIFIFLSFHLCPTPPPVSLLLDWCRIPPCSAQRGRKQSKCFKVSVSMFLHVIFFSFFFFSCHFLTPSTYNSITHLVEMPDEQGHAQQWAEHLI